MSLTRTLVPTGVTAAYPPAGTMTPVGGTSPAILYDGVDGTYLQATTAVWPHIVAFDSFTLPVNEYVDGVRCTVRHSRASGSQVSAMWPRVGAPYGSQLTTATTTTVVTWQSPWWPMPAAAGLTTLGYEWLQAHIDDFSLQFGILSGNATGLRWHESGAEVSTTTIPTPLATLEGLDTSRPGITVTQTDLWTATVATKVLTSNVATLTTSAAHGFLVGNTVTVSGVDATFDGVWRITATPTGTQFSYACVAANVGSTADTGSASIGDGKLFVGHSVFVFAGATADPGETALWSEQLTYPARASASPAIGVDLLPGDYRLYVATQAYSPATGMQLWTAQVLAPFTIAYTLAAPAVLDVAWDEASQATLVAVTTRGNLIGPNPATAEAAGPYATVVTGCTVSRVADTGVDGAYATEMTRTSGGTSMSYGLRNDDGTLFGGVIAGETYLLHVPVKAVTEARDIMCTVDWCDASGTELGVQARSAVVSPAVADGWEHALHVTAVAPVGAVSCYVTVTVAGTPTAAAKWRLDGATLTLAHTPTPNVLDEAYGGQESAAGTWVGVSSTGVARSSDAAWRGTYALRLTASATACTARASRRIGVNPGQTVTARARVRAATASRTVYVDCEWYGNTGTLLSTTSGSATDITTGWITATATGTAPAAASFAMVAVRVTGTATSEVHYVDGVEVRTASNLLGYTAAGAEVQLVAESHVLTNCTWAYSSAQARSGTYSHALTATAAPASAYWSGPDYGAGTSGVAVVPGRTYRVSLWTRAATAARTVTPSIRWDTTGGVLLSTTSGTGAANVTSGWTGHTVTGVAPAGAVTARVGLSIAGTAAAEVHYVDDLLLEPADTVGGWDPGPQYCQGGSGAGLSGLRTLVERSTDLGVTWQQVRAEAGADQTGLGILGERWAGVDYESPRGGTIVYYRASLVADTPTVMTSTMPIPESIIATSDDVWWVKALTAPTLNCGGILLETDPTFTVDEATEVHRPIGRTYPVVVAGAIGGEDGAGTVHTRTAAEHAAVMALARHQGCLLLQSPFVDDGGVQLQWWIRLVNRSWALRGTPTDVRRPIGVQWIDVGPPEMGA